MLINPQDKTLRCLLITAALTATTSSVIAQSNINSPLLGVTARKMLTEQYQVVSSPDTLVRAPYIGIGFGASSLDPDTSAVENLDLVKGDQTGTQLTLGMDFGEWISAEVHFADLGKAELSDNSEVAYREFGASALLYLGNNRDRFNRHGWNVFGRAGLGYLPNGVSDGAGYRQEEAGQWILGAGVEFATKSGFGLRAEGFIYDSDVSYLQLGLLYRFAKMPGGVSGIGDLGVASAARTGASRENALRAEAERIEAARNRIAETGRLDAASGSDENQGGGSPSDVARVGATRSEAELADAVRIDAARSETQADAAQIAQAAQAERAAQLARAERAAQAARAERAAQAAQAGRVAQTARAERLVQAARAERLAQEARIIARADTQAAQRQSANASSVRSRIVLNGVIEGLKFEPGSTRLPESAFKMLDDIAASLKEVSDVKARIGTHTDNVGDSDGNLQLSQKRALVIARYLVQQGVPKTMLEARAFGDRRPIDTNETAAGRYNNGRVEISLVPE